MSGSTLPMVLAGAGASLLFVVITAAGVIMLLRRGAREAEAKLLAALGSPQIVLRDTMANFFGIKSRGATQLRGNGVLLLTKDKLAFQGWFRREPIIISRKEIAEAKTVRSHLGKTVGRDLLSVVYRGDSGGADEIVWLVRELGPWLAALR